MSKRKADSLTNEGSELGGDHLVIGILADPEGLPEYIHEEHPTGAEDRTWDVANQRHSEVVEVAKGGASAEVVANQSPTKVIEVAETIDSTGVVANQRSSREDDVAVEEGVEPSPF